MLRDCESQYQASEQKGSNYQSLNSSLSFEELPDEIKYTIEEEYHNELLSFDTTLKDLKNSLVNEYRKKYLTAEELFLSVEIEKAENEKRDVVNARIKAEMTWESLPDTKKNYWEKLRLICAQFWSQSLSITFFNTFFDFYQNTQSKLKNGEISRDKLNQLKEKYFQFKALTLKRMSTWLLANRIQFVKKSDLVYYNVWKCDDLIEQILNEDPLKASNKQKISQKDKEAFEKFLTPIRLTEQFVNYMVKNEVSYEMRQKYTPLYMFYLEKKDILSSLDVSIEEKMKFIEAEWSKLKEEEKRKYTLQVYDKLYNSTIALYKEEISKSNMATAKKRITFSNRKFKLEDSDDEDYFSESEEEKTLVEESEETVTTIKKRKLNREEKESRTPVYTAFFRDHKEPYVLVRSGSSESSSTSLDRLKSFSYLERLRSKIEQTGRGFVFRHGDDDFILFSGMSRTSALVYMKECGDEIYRKNSIRICSVISEEFSSVLDMEAMIIKCREAYSCSYYASFFSVYEYLIPETEVATSTVEVMKWREMLTAAILSLNEDRIEDCWSSFVTEIATLRESRRDEVCFCFCNCLRLILDKLADSKLKIDEPDLNLLMEKGRETKSYLELTEIFRRELFDIHHQLLERAGQKKTKEYLVALEYIEEHYQEQIGLKQIADLVGMNTYYFSAYFKKNTGENFKDYLRKVRLEHAVSLMISTDKSVTEVAQAVGYPDVRTFSDVFQRVYNEKPSSYIKRVRGK